MRNSSHSSKDMYSLFFFFFQAEDGIRDYKVTGVQTCALPILRLLAGAGPGPSAADPWRRAARHPDDPGHAGRRDPLRGRAGGPPAAAHGPDGGGAARRQPRPVAGPAPNTCVDGYLNRYLATGALPSRPG